jgi:hypothetical protein
MQVYKVDDWLLVKGKDFKEALGEVERLLKDRFGSIELIAEGKDEEDIKAQGILSIDEAITLLQLATNEDLPEDKRIVLLEIAKEKIDKAISLASSLI